MSSKSVLNGLFWNSAESFSLQVLQLFVSMILARLLTPVDFGLIALTVVFITVADAIASGGFRATIIMKQNLTEIDFSTAFIYNLAVGTLLYLLMFFSAPYIAVFYQEPRLVQLIRVLALVNIVHAGYFVQDALLQKHLKFKLLAQRNILAALISGTLACLLAYFGFGVWSLVALTLSRAVVINIFLWIHSVWKFSLKFSYESFKRNFSFGSRMMVSVITGVLFNNLNNLLIGKFYSKADLGFYYQAKKLRDIPVESATGVLNKTAGPVISRYQEDLPNLHKTYFHIIRVAAIIIIPLVTLLFVAGKDLIVVLFSAKWLDSVAIFRIIIITGLFMPFIIINGISPAIMGNSKYYLKLDTIMKIIYLAVIFTALRFGLLVFIAAQTGLTFLQMVINSFVARKFFKIKILEQIRVYAPYYAYSAVAGAGTWLLLKLQFLLPLFQLALAVLAFFLLYLSQVYLFERKTFYDVLRLIKNNLHKVRLKPV